MKKGKSSSNYHHGDLKKALLDSGVSILAEQGIKNLSLREAARRAGVSHTAPYRHFEDKDALLAAIAEEGFNRLILKLEEGIAKHPNNPLQRHYAIGEAYVQFALENPNHLQVMFGNVLEDYKKYSSLKQVSDKSFSLLVETIKDCQKAGIVKKSNAIQLALVAWSAIHGLSLLTIEKRNKWISENNSRIIKILGDVLFNGMKA
ncbi:MAG TPA: TetR/AcrR family transcriptional regulator [Leptospiraceae bacterium]|nr:TetR/AcrR family transcriptional regulator [Leptospiraceae bacterium]HMW04140.1 TetR/AcrR family transcriptional regulator [Leptospiraceae bacterium]HMX30793.1 TetR/AcrR family transcriptional regulator [Leptospiraceae bacterium]HMY30133.1 TetR/AcrR family transcriptional regulator [Leptospiraceae bacterium]HMZ64360.1 TetR/AcrR family transcriptional regulator [Leptospiraceae bacterium]